VKVNGGTCLSIVVVVCAYNILHKLGLIQNKQKKNKATLFHNSTEVYYSWVSFDFDSMRSSAMIQGRDISDTKFTITVFEVCAIGGQSGENFLSNNAGLPQYIFLVTSVVSVHRTRW